MLIPRDYQQAADQALWQFVHQKPEHNPLLILPTGTGKSLQAGMFIWRMLATYPSVKILVATHVKELIENNYNTLLRLWPQAPAGIYSSGLNRRDIYSQVTFVGIQSVMRRPGRFGHVDLLLVDEAHLVGDGDSTSYQKFIAGLRLINPHLIVIGMTATAFRMGSGLLTDGTIFDEVAFDGSDGEAFVWFIENGYLIRPVPKDPGFQLNSDYISLTGSEFNTSETSAAFRDQGILERAVDQTIELGEAQGRKAWLTFCQSIDDAEMVAEMFTSKGYPVEAVHSQRADRDEVLAAFKAGELRGVTNRDILTTGFDYPAIDLIAMLRLTRSPGLWVQMLGRGTRPVYAPGYDLTTREGRLAAIAASDKQTCLVLDYCGNTERLGPINYPMIPKRRGSGGGTPPVRKCPQCLTYHHISIMVCPDCGYEFPPPERVKKEPSVEDLVAAAKTEKVIEVHPVHRMIISEHYGKNGKPNTLKVDYYAGTRRFSSWICLSHPPRSFPRIKAEQWWRAHGGREPVPSTSGEGVSLSVSLNKPKFIKVWTNIKYPEVLEHDFRGTRFELPPELGGPPLEEPESDPVEDRVATVMRDSEGEIPF